MDGDDTRGKIVATGAKNSQPTCNPDNQRSILSCSNSTGDHGPSGETNGIGALATVHASNSATTSSRNFLNGGAEHSHEEYVLNTTNLSNLTISQGQPITDLYSMDPPPHILSLTTLQGEEGQGQRSKSILEALKQSN